MKVYFAPMEGITGKIYRSVWRSLYGDADKVFTPFFSPAQSGHFGRKEERELEGEAQTGNTIPQLLVNRANNFLWAARDLKAMGFREVNLNLGCPSGTVTAKHKGAGMLQDPAELDQLLDTIFQESEHIPAVSVKTRLGFRREEEFDSLLKIFNRYPLRELIVHARIREDYYKAPVRLSCFSLAEECASAPLCYNGDLFTAQTTCDFIREHPHLHAIMLGRGLLANPALIREIRGGKELTAEEFKAFHDALYEAYRAAYNNDEPCLRKMKELWFYFGKNYLPHEKELKAIYKAREDTAYRQAADTILSFPINRGEGICF